MLQLGTWPRHCIRMRNSVSTFFGMCWNGPELIVLFPAVQFQMSLQMGKILIVPVQNLRKRKYNI